MEIERNTLFRDLWKHSQLSIRYEGYVVTDSTWRQDPMFSSQTRLFLVIDGSGIILSDREKVKLEAGYAYLMPSGMKTGYYGTDSVTKLFFNFQLWMPDGYDMFSLCKEFAKMPFAVEKTCKMLEWYRSKDPYDHMLLKAEVFKTVADFAKIYETSVRGQVCYSKLVQHAIGYIQESLNAGLTVSAVAEALGCTPSRINEEFRRQLGTTLPKYVEDLVMSEAQRMLQSTAKSIGEISDGLGFCDQFYFSRRFKKRFAISPKAYRKASKRGIRNE